MADGRSVGDETKRSNSPFGLTVALVRYKTLGSHPSLPTSLGKSSPVDAD